jgi:polysaccharide pyruvyl transferase WcaK-like protein
MNFLIVGGNFYNKGAHLMLLSTISALNHYFPDASICVSPMIGDKAQIQGLGAKALNQPLFHVGTASNLSDWRFRYSLKYGRLLAPFLKNMGPMALKDIDVIFDISGFAYTDQWGLRTVNNLNLFLDHMTAYGAKYIFLPQAFGPFEKPGMASGMAAAFKKAYLIFPRDHVSLNYVTELVDETDKVSLAPDLTLTFGLIREHLGNYCCLIPNSRMLDQGKAEWGDTYEATLRKLAQVICDQSDLEIKVLVHDVGGQDKLIAENLVAALPQNRATLLLGDDAIQLKKVLSSSQFVVGSRFHSLASSLSSGVPALGLGWSHKYMMLFKDYDLQPYSFISPSVDVFTRLEELLSADIRDQIRDSLKIRNQEISEKSNAMWKLVEATI